MPNPTLDTIADLRYMFACMKDREPRGGTGYYDRTGHYKALANISWLLRHSTDIHDLWVTTYTYRSLAIGGGLPYGRCDFPGDFDAILAARLTNGRVFTDTWADRNILKDWLIRPNLSGRTVHWDFAAHIIGSHDYCKEIRVR